MKQIKNTHYEGERPLFASHGLYLEEVTPSFSDNRIEQRPPLRVLCLGNSITRHEYKADIEWFSYYDVRGIGKSRQARIYRGVMYDTSSIERILISIVVRDKNAEKTVQAIIKSAQTGEIGDGRIFVIPIEDAIRIRTAERGDIALYNAEQER